MFDSYDYEVSVLWKHGRVGELSSPDLETSVTCATPPEFEGGVPGIWSPEHLFVAAVNSCLMTTFLAIAQHSRLEFDGFSSHARGRLSRESGKFQMTEIILSPELSLPSHENPEKALKVLEKAKKACLISNSILTRVFIEPRIFVKEFQP